MKNREIFRDVIALAERHGKESEPDHEVGDLIEALSAAFDGLTHVQASAILANAREKAKSWQSFCEHCTGNTLPGILICEFDDRPHIKDGMVFIAKCDECGVYESDVDAAKALAKHAGWTVRKSFDEGSKEYYRSYFAKTVKEVREMIELRT